MTWMSHTRGRLGKLGVLKRALLLKRSGLLPEEKSKALGAMQRTVPMAYRPTPGNHGEWPRRSQATVRPLAYSEDAFVRSLLMRTVGSDDIRVNLMRGEPHVLQRIARRQMELMAAEVEARLRDPASGVWAGLRGHPKRKPGDRWTAPLTGPASGAPARASSAMARRAQRRAVEEFWARGCGSSGGGTRRATSSGASRWGASRGRRWRRCRQRRR